MDDSLSVKLTDFGFSTIVEHDEELRGKKNMQTDRDRVRWTDRQRQADRDSETNEVL